jgi:hypothetical protein
MPKPIRYIMSLKYFGTPDLIRIKKAIEKELSTRNEDNEKIVRRLKQK